MTLPLVGHAIDAARAAADVPAVRIRTLDEADEHPRITARDWCRTIPTKFTNSRTVLPPSLFADLDTPMGDAPALRQHTHERPRETDVDDPEATLPDRGVGHDPHHTHDTEDIAC